MCVAPSSVQFSLVAQSCPTLCNTMDCSTPGFPVHHQLPELVQTHVHRTDDAIKPSHLGGVISFSSCLQSFPASGSFPMTQFFTLGGQNIGVSASASVLPTGEGQSPEAWIHRESLIRDGPAVGSQGVSLNLLQNVYLPTCQK